MLQIRVLFLPPHFQGQGIQRSYLHTEFQAASFPFQLFQQWRLKMEMTQVNKRSKSNFVALLYLENVGVGTKIIFLACTQR
jgi:hypothetical protein